MRKIFSADAPDHDGRFSDNIGYKERGAAAGATLREIIHE